MKVFYILFILLLILSCKNLGKNQKQKSANKIDSSNSKVVQIDSSLIGTRNFVYHDSILIKFANENKSLIQKIRNCDTITIKSLLFPDIHFQLVSNFNKTKMTFYFKKDTTLLGYEIFDSTYISPEGLKIGNSYKKLKEIIGKPIKINNFPYESNFCVLLPCGLVAKYKYLQREPSFNYPDSLKILCFEKSYWTGLIFNTTNAFYSKK